MKFKRMLLPTVIFAVAIVIIAVHTVFACVAYKPVVTQKDFDFSISYTVNGEAGIIEDTFSCKFIGAEQSIDPKDRFYDEKLLNKTADNNGDYLLLSDENGTLVIITNLIGGYLMGDRQYDDSYDEYLRCEPYIAFYDNDGVEYTDEEALAKYNAKITDWDYPERIENDFVMSHITRLTAGNVTMMTLLAIIVILICVIFVKKEKGLEKKSTDEISVIMNFVVGFALIPFLYLLCGLGDINGDGSALSYQIGYCVPAITALGVAASICFRRKGYSVTSLIVQFVGPVVYIISILLEVFLSI